MNGNKKSVGEVSEAIRVQMEAKRDTVEPCGQKAGGEKVGGQKTDGEGNSVGREASEQPQKLSGDAEDGGDSAPECAEEHTEEYTEEHTAGSESLWEWLCSIPGIYYMHREVLLRCFGSPEAVYHASRAELLHLREHGCAWVDHVIAYQAESAPADTVHKRRALGIQFISNVHPLYPMRLRELKNRPYGLFYRGALPDAGKRAVAVIGSRVCTHYGRVLAEQLARQTAEAGGVVISGAAYGIDGAAQWAALAHGGASYGIVGSSVEIRYPKANELLFDRLEREGGVISEFPPGTRPLRAHFPMRNRLISGLADVVAVVEARHGSGSLITADYALEQGRAVLAVPGRLDDELSRGCNELIAQGAGVILSAESFAEQVFPDFREQKKRRTLNITLAPSEKLVYSSLGLHSKSLWELAECTSLSLADLSGSLLALEEKGFAKEVERNYYVKVR